MAGVIESPPLRSALIGLLLAGAPLSGVRAHPHVWIEAVVSPRFEKGAVVALTVDWTFDEFYSTVVAGDFDADGDGTLGSDELAGLAEVSRESLAEFAYFTHVFIDGGPALETRVSELTAAYADGVLSYRFVVPLPEPVDPARRALAFSVYDESYYVDVSLDPVDPVRFQGEWPQTCHFTLAEDQSNPIYFGMVNPIRVDLTCGVS